jgi:hypothetical protein
LDVATEHDGEEMTSVRQQLERIEEAKLPVFWLGAATNDAIATLERHLGARLPPSFREFLRQTGGGEIATAPISGVDSSDPTSEDAGTVLGDTARWRQEFGLPDNLFVIYTQDEEVCWCLDTSRPDGTGEYPVVSYSPFTRCVDAQLARTFLDWLAEFVDGCIRHR